MADKYDKNGYGGSDFKRNAPQEHALKAEQDGDESNPLLSEKAGEYMKELLGEKVQIDQQKFPISTKLLDQEVSKVQTLGRVPSKDLRYVDIYREKPIKVSVKVLVPVKEHPKFNFVGKLLGPKGNSMKRLQEETMCKMAVLGRGSMKDKQKEEEMRQAMDPKYAHLSDDLHVEITALGPPAEAHARIAFALAEVRKYLIPDSNDVIRQEQLREMLDPAGPPRHPRPDHPPLAAPELPAPPRALFRPPVPRAAAGVDVRGASSGRSGGGRVMPAKTKIMSILDRARAAMEETYGYEDGYDGSPAGRDDEYYGAYDEPPPPPPHMSEYGPPHHHHASHQAPPHHHYAPPPHHHHRESAAAASTAVAESYHYPPVRHHPVEHEYGVGSTSSSHHRSYKAVSGSRSDSHSSAMRRTASASQDQSRYRSSPYTRRSK